MFCNRQNELVTPWPYAHSRTELMGSNRSSCTAKSRTGHRPPTAMWVPQALAGGTVMGPRVPCSCKPKSCACDKWRASPPLGEHLPVWEFWSYTEIHLFEHPPVLCSDWLCPDAFTWLCWRAFLPFWAQCAWGSASLLNYCSRHWNGVCTRWILPPCWQPNSNRFRALWLMLGLLQINNDHFLPTLVTGEQGSSTNKRKAFIDAQYSAVFIPCPQDILSCLVLVVVGEAAAGLCWNSASHWSTQGEKAAGRDTAQASSSRAG